MARKKAAGTPRAARRRVWWHLRQRWRMLGVFEINPDHELYHLTSMIKEGMHAAIRASMDTPAEVTVFSFKATSWIVNRNMSSQNS